MALLDAYRSQVALLVRVLPFVARETDFALKGGTAINLFVRDLPRLSVDIDLTFLPIADRPASLLAIEAAMLRIADTVTTGIKGAQVTAGRLQPDNRVTKLVVRHERVQIKIEVTPVIRGVVYPAILRTVSPRVEQDFGFAEMQVTSFADLYAGKIVAALDRQHPRDLFDVRDLLAREGIDDALRSAFLIYVLSHPRPIAELLAPTRRSLEEEYARGFQGMTAQAVPLEALLDAREAIIAAMVAGMGYHFDGTMIDREGWQARRVAAGDLIVIRSLLADASQVRDADFVARIIAGLYRAAQDNDVHVRARAVRIRGELLEETGDAAAALVAYDQALSLDPQVGVTRRADKLRKALSPGSVPDRKLSKFERQAERVGIAHEVITLHCGEPKLWRHGPEDTWASVEEAALAHYVAQGWSGAAAEGGLMLTLIKAASFARLQPRNADTYIEALYAQNVAFDEDRLTRGALIDACGRATTAQISRNWALIAATAGETPAFYPQVRWHHVSGLFDALGTERLAAIARLFADAPYDLRAGWPDLTLWRDREVRFVEVKRTVSIQGSRRTRQRRQWGGCLPVA